MVALVLATGIAAVASTGSAAATHNPCDGPNDDDVWFVFVGADPTPNVGVCVGDAAVFVDATGPGLASVGITTCDSSSQPYTCNQYSYFGMDSVPTFGPTCVYFTTWEGGDEPEEHAFGLDC